MSRTRVVYWRGVILHGLVPACAAAAEGVVKRKTCQASGASSKWDSTGHTGFQELNFAVTGHCSGTILSFLHGGT